MRGTTGLDLLISMAMERLHHPRVRTATYAALGSMLIQELREEAERSPSWEAASFDRSLSRVRAKLMAEGRWEAEPHPESWVRVSFLVTHCERLGIAGPEQIAYGRALKIFPFAFVLDKESVTARIRRGWGDWLRENVPRQYGPNPVRPAELAASIRAQRSELYD